MNKQRLLVIAILAASSSMAFAGGTERQAPAEAEAVPAPAPAPIIAPAAPVVVYQPVNYVGIGIGASHFSGNCAISNHDTGYKIFAGHHLTPHIGVELSYVDLGRSNDDLACLGAAAGRTGGAAGTGSNTGGASGGSGSSSGGATSGGGTGTGGSGAGAGGSGGGGAGAGGSGSGGASAGGSGSGGASAGGSGSGGASAGGSGSGGVSAGGSGSGGVSAGSGSAGGSGSGSGSGTGSSVSTVTTSGGTGNVNVGSGSVTSSGSGSGSGSGLAVDPRVKGVGLALVAGMPFFNNAGSIYVKGGAFFYHATDDVNGGNSNNGTSPFYGVGAQYNFGVHNAVRAEYERYHNVGTAATGKQNIDLASVSYVYRF